MSNLLYYTFVVASSVVGSTNKFINICQSFATGDFPLSKLLIKST
jgi:ABC-type glucose/galactose transport system permease subunit